MNKSDKFQTKMALGALAIGGALLAPEAAAALVIVTLVGVVGFVAVARSVQ